MILRFDGKILTFKIEHFFSWKSFGQLAKSKQTLRFDGKIQLLKSHNFSPEHFFGQLAKSKQTLRFDGKIPFLEFNNFFFILKIRSMFKLRKNSSKCKSKAQLTLVAVHVTLPFHDFFYNLWISNAMNSHVL